jgi:hypothetical protein
MFWLASALGIRPRGLPTGQAVCKVVTLFPENHIFYFLYFQSLAHSCENENSATLVSSIGSALFDKNTGGRYLPHPPPRLFKGWRTFTPSDLCEGLFPLAPRPDRWSRVVLRASAAIPFLGRFRSEDSTRAGAAASRRNIAYRCFWRLFIVVSCPSLLLFFHRYTLLPKEQFTWPQQQP